MISPYPPRYRTAFASSSLLCPPPHQPALRRGLPPRRRDVGFTMLRSRNDGWFSPCSHTGGRSCPCVPMRRWNNRPRRHFGPSLSASLARRHSRCLSQFTYVGPATQPNPSTTFDARSQGDFLAVVSPSRRTGCIVAAASDQTVTSLAGVARLLRTEPQVRYGGFFLMLNNFFITFMAHDAICRRIRGLR
jgi:hypothetical protein